MENIKTQSQWSGAAREGLLLSLFTIIPTLIGSLTGSGVLSILTWTVKTVGSAWMLYHFMKKWASSTGADSAFGYGFKICLCSSVICAVWAFALVQYITPDSIGKVMAELDQALANQPGIDQIEDMLLWFEDNFAQINAIATLVGCILYGLIISAIMGRSAASSNVFAPNQNQNGEEL